MLLCADSVWVGPKSTNLAELVIERQSNRESPNIFLKNTSGQTLENATVAVAFKRLGADHILVCQFLDSWAPSEAIEFTHDVRIRDGGIFVIGSSVSVWCEQGVQSHKMLTFPSQEKLIQTQMQRVEEVKRRRDKLESLFESNRQFEGRWTLGIHKGKIGLEFLQPTKSGNAVEINSIRIYEPTSPAVYKNCKATFTYDFENQRYVLFVDQQRHSGIDGLRTRIPSTKNLLLKSKNQTFRLFLDGDFRCRPFP